MLGLLAAMAGRFTPVRTGKTHRRALLLGMFAGSPPCVRGRPYIAKRQAPNQRFTPVRTGKTSPLPATLPRSAVHPRAYGEDVFR